MCYTIGIISFEYFHWIEQAFVFYSAMIENSSDVSRKEMEKGIRPSGVFNLDRLRCKKKGTEDQGEGVPLWTEIVPRCNLKKRAEHRLTYLLRQVFKEKTKGQKLCHITGIKRWASVTQARKEEGFPVAIASPTRATAQREANY